MKIIKYSLLLLLIALVLFYIVTYDNLDTTASNETSSESFVGLKDKSYCLVHDMVVVEMPSGMGGYHDNFGMYRLRVRNTNEKVPGYSSSASYPYRSLAPKGTKVTFRETWRYIDHDIEMLWGTFEFLAEVHNNHQYDRLVNASVLVSGNHYNDPFLISQDLLTNCEQ